LDVPGQVEVQLVTLSVTRRAAQSGSGSSGAAFVAFGYEVVDDEVVDGVD